MNVHVLVPAAVPWGDFGRILTHGMSAHLPRSQGRIRLERTAPFVPPISFPGADTILTEDARTALEQSGLSGVVIREVEKARIVRVDWETWDKRAVDPPVMPASRSPEDYILDAPDDRGLAAAIGELWELTPPTGGTGRRTLVQKRPREYTTTVGLTGALDFFRVSGLRQILVSDAAKEWLESHLREWVRFEPVQVE